MSETFRVEIESTEASQPLTPDQLENKRIQMQRRLSIEARQQRSAELREERNERAILKERDRQADREDRLRRQEERDKKSALREREREEKKIERERLRGIANVERAERLFNASRRKYINDLFGTFNNAHLGRRINHAIDFIQSLVGLETPESIDEEQTNVPTSLEKKETAKEVVIKDERRENIPTQILGQNNKIEVEPSKDFSKVIADALGNARLNSERPFNLLNSSNRSEINNSFVNRLKRVENLKMRYESALKPLSNNFLGENRIARSSIFAFNGGNRSNQRQTQNIFNNVSQRTSGVLNAISGATGGRISPQMVGVLAGTAALATTIGGLTASFVLLDQQSKKLTDSLSGIPSPVIFAQINNRLEMFQKRLERAGRFGEVLAEIELERGRQQIAGEGIADNLVGPFLPLVREANRGISNVLEGIEGLTEIGATLVSPFTEGLGEILRLLNSGVDLVGGTKTTVQTFAESLITMLSPWIGIQLQAQRQAKQKEQGKAMSDVIRQAYEFLNVESVINAPQDTQFVFGGEI